MSDEIFDLRLYVAGQTPKAIRAFANLRKICDEHLAGRYRIEVIDLLEDPQLGRGDQILALPTLVRQTAGADQEDHRRPLQHRARARGPGPASAPEGTRDRPREQIDRREPGSAASQAADRALRAPAVRHRHDAAVHARRGERARDLRGAPAGPVRPRGHRHLPAADPGQGRADHRGADADQEAAAAAAPHHRRSVQHRARAAGPGHPRRRDVHGRARSPRPAESTELDELRARLAEAEDTLQRHPPRRGGRAADRATAAASGSTRCAAPMRRTARWSSRCTRGPSP